MPAELDGIIADATNLLKLRFGHCNEAALRAMPLAHSAGAITSQIRLVVLSDMTVDPCHAHDAARLEVINLSWVNGHGSKFHQSIAQRGHETDLMAIDEVRTWRCGMLAKDPRIRQWNKLIPLKQQVVQRSTRKEVNISLN